MLSQNFKAIVYLMLLSVLSTFTLGATTIDFVTPTDINDTVIDSRNWTIPNITTSGQFNSGIDFDGINFTFVSQENLCEVGTNPTSAFTDGYDGLGYTVENLIPPRSFVYGCMVSMGEADDVARCKIMKHVSGGTTFETYWDLQDNALNVSGDVDRFAYEFPGIVFIPDDGAEYYMGFHTIAGDPDIAVATGSSCGSVQRYRLGDLAENTSGVYSTSAVDTAVTALTYGQYDLNSTGDVTQPMGFNYLNLTNYANGTYEYYAWSNLSGTFNYTDLRYITFGGAITFNTTIVVDDLNDAGVIEFDAVMYNATETHTRTSAGGTATFPPVTTTFTLNITKSEYINRTGLSITPSGGVDQFNYSMWQNELTIMAGDQWQLARTGSDAIGNFTIQQGLQNNVTAGGGQLKLRTKATATFAFTNLNESTTTWPDYSIVKSFTPGTVSAFTAFVPYGTINISAYSLLTGAAISSYSINQSDQLNQSVKVTTSSGFLQLNSSPNVLFNITIDGSGQFASDSILQNTTLQNYNFTFNLSVLNSVYLLLQDEISREFINNWSLTVRGDDFAINVTTITGNVSLELLSPQEYLFEYTANDYAIRHYYLTLLNDTSTNITLYDLNNTNGTIVDFVVKDEDFQALEGVIVRALRYYLDDNAYSVVAMRKTDFEGRGQFFLQQDDPFYRYAIIKDGVTLFVSTGSVLSDFIVANGMNFAVQTQTNILNTVDALNHVSANIVYSNVSDSGLFTFTFSDGTGLSRQGCLKVTYVTAFGTEDNTTCVVGSAAVITVALNQSNAGSYTAQGFINTDAQFLNGTYIIAASAGKTFSDAFSILNLTGVLFSVLLFIGFALMFMRDPAMSVIGTGVSFGLVALFGFTTISYALSVAVLAVSILISMGLDSGKK